MKINNKITAVTFLIIASVVIYFAAVDFNKMNEKDILYPSHSLTKTMKLSDYNPSLINSNGDTDIYFFNGKQDGATVLVLGGTHPNEPAGFIAAVLLIENINVNVGKVIVIPQACQSGFSCTDPMEGYPEFFTVQTQSGLRKFRFGSRVSNPLDQWPDPLVYSHYPSGDKLSGFETRNLNRNYPGRLNGTFTEQVAYGIVELIKKENVTVAFDLHEAAPEIPIINAIVYHEKSEDIALNAILNLQMEDLNYSPEKSPKTFRGLSHREWGDSTNTFPFLMETCNPIQGRLRGKTNEELILNGISGEYKEAQATGKLRIEYDTDGEKLDKRVARHIEGIVFLLNSYNELYPDKPVLTDNLPSYNEILGNGLSKFLH